MSKKSFNDVVKIKRINRDVLPEKSEKILHKELRPIHHHIDENKNLPRHFLKENTHSGNSRYTLWFVALISVIFLLFALSFLFSSAKVSVNPKIQDVTLNENLLVVT